MNKRKSISSLCIYRYAIFMVYILLNIRNKAYANLKVGTDVNTEQQHSVSLLDKNFKLTGSGFPPVSQHFQI